MSRGSKAQSSDRQHGLCNISKKSPKSVSQTSLRHPHRSPPTYSMPVHDLCNACQTKSCQIQNVNKNLRKINKKSRRIKEGMSILSAVPQKGSLYSPTISDWRFLTDFSHPITHASHKTSTFRTHHRHHSDTLFQSLTYPHYYQLGLMALSQTHHYFPLCDWMRQMQRATSYFNHSLQIRSQLFDRIAILFLAFAGCVLIS